MSGVVPPKVKDRVRRAILGVMPPGLDVIVEPRPEARAPTFGVTIVSPGARHELTVAWAGRGWPADVERAAALAPEAEAIVAPGLSEGAREWLAGQGLGWADGNGAARLITQSGLVVERQGAPPSAERPPTAGWNRSMLAAAEAVCSGDLPTVDAIEARTGLSRGGVAAALARLESLGLLERPGDMRGPRSARQVVDSDAFLDAYSLGAAALRARRPAVQLHCLTSDPLAYLEERIAPALIGAGETWAATGAAASMLLAPYLSGLSVVDLYVSGDLLADRARLADLLDGRVVQSGHRIVVRELPTPVSAGGPTVEGVRLALPARIYADLTAEGGRSAEAAQHLREVIDLGPPA